LKTLGREEMKRVFFLLAFLVSASYCHAASYRLDTVRDVAIPSFERVPAFTHAYEFEFYEGDRVVYFRQKGLHFIKRIDYEVRTPGGWSAVNYRPNISLTLVRVTVRLLFFKSREVVDTVEIPEGFWLHAYDPPEFHFFVARIHFDGPYKVRYLYGAAYTSLPYSVNGVDLVWEVSQKTGTGFKDKCMEAEEILGEMENGSTGRRLEEAIFFAGKHRHNDSAVLSILENTYSYYMRAKRLALNARCNDALGQAALARESAQDFIKAVLFNSNANERAIILNDNVAPTVELQDITYSLELSSSQLVTVRTKDIGIGVSSVQLDLGDGGGLVDMAPLGDGTFVYSWTPGWIGDYTITVYAYDYAGNSVAVPLSFTVVDTLPPEITDSSISSNKAILGESLTLLLTAEDIGTGVSHVEVVYDGVRSNMTVLPDGGFLFSWTPGSLGWQSITAYVYDYAGNIAEKTFYYEVIAPPVSLDSHIRGIEVENALGEAFDTQMLNDGKSNNVLKNGWLPSDTIIELDGDRIEIETLVLQTFSFSAWWGPSYFPYSYTISVSNDGASWEPVIVFDNGRLIEGDALFSSWSKWLWGYGRFVWHAYSFNKPIRARYIRIHDTKTKWWTYSWCPIMPSATGCSRFHIGTQYIRCEIDLRGWA
jgi:hypothetical protein